MPKDSEIAPSKEIVQKSPRSEKEIIKRQKHAQAQGYNAFSLRKRMA